MVRLPVSCLDLDQIARSGQCFTWEPVGDGGWRIPHRDRLVTARQEGDSLLLSCSEAELEDTWRAYLDLDTDYAAILASIDPADPCLSRAAERGRGIRILRQDLWEVMVCFLISQNNNIARITRSVAALRAAYGRPAGAFRAFPRPDELPAASEAGFRAMGLGYRAGYLARLVKALSGGGLGRLEEALSAADDQEAEALLMGFHGIGRKVADCICLFGLHRTDFFPVDTHIRQVLSAHYPQGFPFDRYQGHLGIVQQYLFYSDL